VLQEIRLAAHRRVELVRVVEQHRPQRRVFERRSAIEHEPDTVGEGIGPEVHLQEMGQRRLAFHWSFDVESGIQDRPNAIYGVDLEGNHEVVELCVHVRPRYGLTFISTDRPVEGGWRLFVEYVVQNRGDYLLRASWRPVQVDRRR